MLRPAAAAKALKPFDCYTEAEREEIVFWKRVLAEWEKYRQRGGMSAAELDKRFLAYLALEYPDRKLSIATLYRKRKALAEGDLDGLVDGRGKGRKGKRNMAEPVWTFFRARCCRKQSTWISARRCGRRKNTSS